MMKGLVALMFLVLVVIIVFLMFQINDNSSKCRENRVSQQDRVSESARLIVQSATQDHPLFKHIHAIQAKLIIDDVIHQNGSAALTEKNLKLESGKIEELREKIYQQYEDVECMLMEKLTEIHPQLDVDVNEMAGLKKKKRRHRKKHSEEDKS